jgi:hypothetical protein
VRRIATWTLPLLAAVFYLAAAPGSASAQEKLRPSWTCVPEPTALIARIPGGQAFFEALKKQTKLGAVLSNSQRFDRLKSLLLEQADTREEWDTVVKELAKYKLTPEDAGLLFDGDLGVGVTVEPGSGKTPIALIYAWLEPGDDLADRMYAAVQQAVEEHSDDAKRADIELAGATVMHLTLKTSVPKVDPDVDAEEADKVPADEHIFLAKVGKRLLGIMCVTSADDAANKSDELAERLQSAFGKFLDAHHRESDTLPAIMQTQGLAAAMPAGVPLMEVLMDVRPLYQLFVKAAENAEDTDKESAEKSLRMARALGAETLGTVAVRTSLDGNALASSAFVALPTPRVGLFTLLDQPTLPAEPAAWVSSDVVSYDHVSFDIGKAYSRIKGIVVDELGPDAGAGINFIENSITAKIGVDVIELLSSLGQQHSTVSFVPKVDAAKADEGDSLGTGRTGVVWQVKNEDIWRKVMQLGAAATGQEPVEEQGFLGLRVSQGGFEGGVFLGRGFLVLGMGDEVIESVLSMLRNPPAGDASLRGSALYRRACELLPPQAGLTYQISDNNRNMKAVRQVMLTSLEAVKRQQAGADDEDVRRGLEILEKAIELLPSEDELEGTLGVSAAQTTVDDSGVVNRSVLDLPAPR